MESLECMFWAFLIVFVMVYPMTKQRATGKGFGLFKR